MKTDYVSESSPWHPLLFVPLAAVAGWGIAGVLAALNYRCLGKPARMWPTILLSWVTFSGFMLIVGAAQTALQLPISLTLVVIIIADLIAGVMLMLAQRNETRQWSTEHGRTSWQGGISLYSLLIGMSIVNWILASLPYFFLAIFALSLWATCTYFLTTFLGRGVGGLSFTQAQQKTIALIIGLGVLCVLGGLCMGVMFATELLRYSISYTLSQ